MAILKIVTTNGDQLEYTIGNNKVKVEGDCLLFRDNHGNMYGMRDWAYYQIIVGDRRARD